MRAILKKITHPFLKYTSQKYFSKPRIYGFEGIKVKVMPEVFPPHCTLSTKILLEYLKPLDLNEKTLLELGSGSGIIALYAASKGAKVTASDINTIALTALKENSSQNGLDIEIVESDLFQNIKQQRFDYIIINPPYYAKQPKNIKEQAWFCGENFEYFQKLFEELTTRTDHTILMILSQDCDIMHIKHIAKQWSLHLTIEQEQTKLLEQNYIFRISKDDKSVKT